MRRRDRQSRLTAALWANAAALALIGLALLLRPGGINLLPQAQAQIPVSGGAGLYLMPAQLANNVFGVYLLDVDRQTMMVYRYETGAGSSGTLRFLAARSVVNDRRLGQYNTEPKPQDIKAVADAEQQTDRLRDDAADPARPNNP